MDEDNRITEHAEDEHFVVKLDMDPRMVRPYHDFGSDFIAAKRAAEEVFDERKDDFIHTIVSPAAEAAKDIRAAAMKAPKLPRFYYAIMGSKKISHGAKKIALARIRELNKVNGWCANRGDWDKCNAGVQLYTAFWWSETPENHDFWYGIHKLISID